MTAYIKKEKDVLENRSNSGEKQGYMAQVKSIHSRKDEPKGKIAIDTQKN
jgi:hypothetical protein